MSIFTVSITRHADKGGTSKASLRVGDGREAIAIQRALTGLDVGEGVMIQAEAMITVYGKITLPLEAAQEILEDALREVMQSKNKVYR